MSLVYFYALFSLFPPHPHIVRHCVESRDFVRTHMSSDSKTMYHVVSGISLQSHRYIFGNVTAVLSLYIYVCAFLLYIPQCSGVLCLLHVSHFLPLRHLVTDREGVASPFPKLFSWDFQNCRWLCSCMKFVWFCWDFQICSWIVVWSLYLFVNALPFLICVLKLFSICVLKPFRISSSETGDGLFCFSSSILLLQIIGQNREFPIGAIRG